MCQYAIESKINLQKIKIYKKELYMYIPSWYGSSVWLIDWVWTTDDNKNNNKASRLLQVFGQGSF